MRCGLLAPIGRNSPSPLPTSFSAPGWSRMTRLSASDEVAKASRLGTLALIRPGHDVDRRALRREHQVDAGGPGQLGDADDRVLDVARRDHHQVGELVDDDQQIGVRRQHALAPRRHLDRAGSHGLVEVVDVAEAEVGQVVVPLVHLADHPLQRLGRLLRAGDDRRDQVRDAFVARQLDPLRVDHDHPDLVGRRPHQQRADHRVDEARLAGAGGAGDQQVRHLRQVGDDEAALDVLAEADDHRVVVVAGLPGRAARRRATRSRRRRSGSRRRSRTCRGSATGCARRRWRRRRRCSCDSAVTFSTFTAGPSSTS